MITKVTKANQTMQSASCENLVKQFPAALASKDKMRGWKRSLTLYCNRRSEESGTKPERFRAAVKMQLTKAGYDYSAA